MFVLSNFIQAIATILYRLLDLYKIVVFVSVLISWVNPDPSNVIVRFLRSVTEPVFALVRRVIPFSVIGMLDLSPLVVLLLIYFIQMFVVSSLFDAARMMK